MEDDGKKTGLWNAAEISKYLENLGFEVNYNEFNGPEIQDPVVEGHEDGVNYHVFDMGGRENTDLKAILSFDYERGGSTRHPMSKPSFRDIRRDLNEPQLVDLKEENGRVYVTSDLSSAPPGEVAKEFAEIYEIARDL